MGKIRSKRLILGTAVLFGCGGLLAACAGDPPKPAPVVMSAPPPIADAGPPLSSSPRIAPPAPVRRTVAREVAQRPARVEARRSRHLASSKEHRHAAKATHHKTAKHHIARKGTAPKQAKLSAAAKTTQPKS
jgi:hypothetical protein